MSLRSAYLLKQKAPKPGNEHVGLFIPIERDDREDLEETWQMIPPIGGMIHVAGTRVRGFKLEFKRNFDTGRTVDLILKRVGTVESRHVHDVPGLLYTIDETPRGLLEMYAAQIPVPPGGQDPNSATVQDCQTWLIQFLQRLETEGVITDGAAMLAQGYIQAPTYHN